MHHALSGHGITVGQFMTLNHIMRRPGVNRAELARELQITPQAVGGLITQLVHTGLVARTTARPGRPIALTVTPAGTQRLAEAAPTLDALTRELLLRCVRADRVAALDGAFRHVFSRLSTPEDCP
jgi:DNA-binding MarR family transcriptional regulator